MTKLNSRRLTCIWLSVIILLVSVAATTIAYVSRLDNFLLDDVGAIDLLNNGSNVTDDTKSTQDSENTVTQSPTASEKAPESNGNAFETQGSYDAAPNITPPITNQPIEPGFEVDDGTTVWSTNTRVEIFRVSYVNGENVITVNSNNGEKVIAPGTQNSYTFKLKNTGNVALDYIVEIDAYFTPANIDIPITGRLNRYDGKWVVGSKNEYVSVPTLDAAVDGASLGAGKYTYYTLDWQWLYESGNDELDTMLGDLAKNEDLIFTIVIKTTAVVSDNPNDDSGITPPQTSDNSNITLWSVIAIFSFIMMIFLIFYKNGGKRRYGTEAD